MFQCGRPDDRGPTDQIVGGRGEARSFTPVHPESTVHSGGQHTAVDDLGDDGAALGGAHGVRRTGEGGTVFGPRPQIARGGDEERADLAVERRVQAHEAAIGGFDHPRVFAPAGPLPCLPGVVSGVDHRCWFDVEADAVGARGQSDAGRPAVATDSVLGSEQQVNLSVTDDATRIEHVLGRPANLPFAHRTGKSGVGPCREHRTVMNGERAESPVVAQCRASCCRTRALGRTLRSRSMIPKETS
jgi:hypothetical protein